MAGARADLESALTFDARHGTANWLMGLVHHLNGDAQKAEAARQRATAVSDIFNHPFPEAKTPTDLPLASDMKFLSQASPAPELVDHTFSTDFLSPPATSVDWDDLPIEDSLPVKDEAYWRQFVADQPMRLGRVPVSMRTPALCAELVASAGSEPARFAAWIPDSVFTPDLALALVRRCSANLQWIPSRLIDRALCLQTPEDERFSLKHVPRPLQDRALCLHAVACGASLDEVPTDWVDREMCETAVKRHCYQIDLVPATHRDQALYVLAMAYGQPYFVNNHVPSRHKTTEMLRKVIDVAPRALDAIPGRLFDADLYAYAESKYGCHPDWPQIVARHHQEACRESGDCAEKCWLVFWDEPFMLEQIVHKQYHLGPYEIPRSHFTAAIAAACFKRDLIHLGFIPTEFVTPDMCRKFIRAHADQLADVPFELRDVPICVTALLKNPDQITQVPPAHHAAVFETLLTRHRDGLDMNWLLFERGQGYLMAQPHQLDAAAADFSTVLQGKGKGKGKDHDSHCSHATFLLGYCKYLEGDLAAADQYLRESGYTDSYATLDLTANKQTQCFDRGRFDELMREASQLGDNGDWNEAYSSVLAAEHLLRQSGTSAHESWAFMLDHKRWISHELELWDVNEATCHEAIGRLEKVTLWGYLRSSDIVRHALRASYNRLAGCVLDQEAPSHADLQVGLDWVEKAFALKGPAESDSVHDEFHEVRTALLLALTEFDPTHAARLDKALAEIERLNLREKGFIGLESVITALDSRAT
jgi:hypothetical protein